VSRKRAPDAAAARTNSDAGSSEDTLNRGQVAALLELLREAVVRGRYIAVDTTLHGLCGGQGVNASGLRWAAERIAEDLIDPGPAAAAAALASCSHPDDERVDT
jgi:hypothetical protein